MRRSARLVAGMLVVFVCGAGHAAAAGMNAFQAVSAGGDGSCALTSAGGVDCWGDNSVGELGNGTSTSSSTPAAVSLPATSNATAISVGGDHGCALLSSGSVYCWGDNSAGELGNGTTTTTSTPVKVSLPVGSTAIAVSAGAFQTCALLASGGVDCWGENADGQLGNGTTVSSSTPVKVSLPAGRTATAVSAGGGHTCALLATGGIDCWGSNNSGQLGNASITGSSTPVTVSLPAGSTATAVSAGAADTCAVLASGGVDCWGDNTDGQLGNDTTTDSAVPFAVKLPAGTTATAVTTGAFHTCTVLAAGGVDCWGENADGQLGNGTTSQSLTPVAVSLPGATAAAIAAGTSHTCGLLSSGTIDCWGDNAAGDLGNGTTAQSSTPVALQLGSGRTSTLAASPKSLTADGSAKSTITVDAEDANGRALTTGGDSVTVASTLGTVAAVTDHRNGTYTATVTSKTAGTAALSATINGQTITTGNPTVTFTPGAASAGTSTIIAAPSAVRADGTSKSTITVRAVDANGNAETSGGASVEIASTLGTVSGVTDNHDGTYTATLTSTTTGTATISATINAKTITTGNPAVTFLDTTVGIAGGAGSQTIAAGDEYSCALTVAGRAECWGENDGGELGDGPAMPSQSLTPMAVLLPAGSNATSIATGIGTGCVVLASGGVDCWGDNGDGEVGDPAYTISIVSTPLPVSLPAGVTATAVSVGAFTSCALLASGGVDCWGLGAFGELGNGTFTGETATPVPVSLPAGATATAIASGDDSTCALLASGGVDCWGVGDSGQLGNGTDTYSSTPVPVSLPAGETAVAVTANGLHACALLSSGGVDCWGDNQFGELGNGTTTSSPTPVPVSLPAGAKVRAIAAGGSHTCALLSSGGVDCWGDNRFGQFGNGTTTSSTTPVPASLPAGAVATEITGGAGQTCVLLSSGGLDCWGDNGFGDLGNNSTTTSSTPVAVHFGSGQTSTLTASPGSVAANGTTKAMITLRAEDPTGRALSLGGDTVAIASSIGTVSGVTDNGDGTYTASLVSRTTGIATVSATINGQTLTTGNPTVMFTPGAASASMSTIATVPSSVTADGSAKSTITVEAIDANGNALTSGGDTVAVASSLGTVSAVKDNGDGTYTATLSSSSAGKATVSATIDGHAITSGKPTVIFTPGAASAAMSTVTAAPGSVTADGASKATVTVQAIDSGGNDETSGGDTIELASTLGILSGVTDDHDGTYTATLTSTSAGKATVSATINGKAITAGATVKFIPGGASAGTSTIAAAPSSVTADGSSSATVTVRAIDANGNQETSGGDTVVVASSLGTVSAVKDNGDGSYTATLTSAVAGKATVSATIDGKAITSGKPTVTFTPGAASAATSMVTAAPTSVTADGSSSATVTVRAIDAKGNDETSGGDTITVTSTLGTVSAVKDNGDGTYAATLTSTKPGQATISGSIGGQTISTAKATVTFTVGAASADESTIVATPASVIADGSSSATVTVQAIDATGNDETSGGDTVAVASTLGTVSAVKDRGDGMYTATLTSTSAGKATVSATINGKAISSGDPAVTFTPPETVTPMPSPTTTPFPTPTPTPTPAPAASRCPANPGALTTAGIGTIRLGENRTQARAGNPYVTERSLPDQDFFCDARAGYPSATLLKTLAQGQRGRVRNTIIWISTDDPAQVLAGIHPGAGSVAAESHLKGGSSFTVGRNTWYMVNDQGVTVMLKIQHDEVQEVGIAARLLTASRRTQRTFIHSMT